MEILYHVVLYNRLWNGKWKITDACTDAFHKKSINDSDYYYYNHWQFFIKS